VPLSPRETARPGGDAAQQAYVHGLIEKTVRSKAQNTQHQLAGLVPEIHHHAPRVLSPQIPQYQHTPAENAFGNAVPLVAVAGASRGPGLLRWAGGIESRYRHIQVAVGGAGNAITPKIGEASLRTLLRACWAEQRMVWPVVTAMNTTAVDRPTDGNITTRPPSAPTPGNEGHKKRRAKGKNQKINDGTRNKKKGVIASRSPWPVIWLTENSSRAPGRNRTHVQRPPSFAIVQFAGRKYTYATCALVPEGES